MLDMQRRLLDQETTKPQNVGVTLARFAGYFRKYWPGLLLVLIFIMVATWAQVTTPELIGQAVDCYLYQPQATAGMAAAVMGEDAAAAATADTCWWTDDDAAAIAARINADTTIAEADKQGAINTAKLAGVGSVVLTLIGLYVLGAVLTGLSFYAMAWSGQNVLRDIRKALFRQIHRLSLGYYVRHEAGNVMSRITNDTDTIQQVFSNSLLQVFSSTLLMTWIALRMLQTNFVYALISLLVVPVMVWTTIYFSGQARKAYRRAREQLGNVNADLQESIAGAREVQAFNRENETILEFQESNAANRDANVRAATFTTAMTPMLEALGYLALTIVVVAGGLSMLQNAPLLGIGSVVTLGLIITYIQYVQRLTQPIQQIALLWTNIQNAIAGGERIFGLLDEKADITDKPDAKDLPPIEGRVTFDNVSAEYERGVPVLKDVSFHAEPGQMIAIVGPTGAGKTTIINLLPRFYDVTGGAVSIDGHDVRDVTIASLRSQIGIVLQDTFLFSDTVMNNIRYGRVDASDDEVIAAAKLVAADTFIEKLPDGYQTVLGERGSGLSQGQRQLIAIARVALMNPRLLILDEATSSVDTRTERIIQRAFEQLLAGRTSFVIAHRLSTIRNADLLLVLKDGDIVERGTHDSLLEQRGAYYELYMSQFRHEADEPAAAD
ncbi:MAG: ABC transporter ATP-binding protein [Anaerolineae bacterium]|nr:MAG: ABC transporter-like protein [Chloroflexi bacterium OLB13]MBW7880350.1 ABC transporter ATP-binding protein [Anaerolineae bacterium]